MNESLIRYQTAVTPTESYEGCQRKGLLRLALSLPLIVADLPSAYLTAHVAEVTKIDEAKKGVLPLLGRVLALVATVLTRVVVFAVVGAIAIAFTLVPVLPVFAACKLKSMWAPIQRSRAATQDDGSDDDTPSTDVVFGAAPVTDKVQYTA